MWTTTDTRQQLLFNLISKTIVYSSREEENNVTPDMDELPNTGIRNRIVYSHTRDEVNNHT